VWTIFGPCSDISFGLGLDVLILGFDSLSHMTYRRKLAKTYKYFTENLKGIVLNGYNIVGDGTPQALIPIFTGKTELELPRTLKRLAKKEFVDVYPMVWNPFKTIPFKFSVKYLYVFANFLL
jgi:hypothetical protein